MLQWGLGSTNLVARPTATAAELSRAELRAGVPHLRSVVDQCAPLVVAYTGKGVYPAATGKPQAAWGEQPTRLFVGAVDFVLPSPSGLARLPIAEKLPWFTELATLTASLAAGR